MDEGIIIGVDQSLEWTVAWWLENYYKYNTHPVCIIDLGMSFEMKRWCKDRLQVIALRMADFDNPPAKGARKRWKKESGTEFIGSRSVWFKKPFACLLSPFQKTLWIDVDCEIKANIKELFGYANDFAIAKDFDSKTSYPTYNSGVIAFQKAHPIIQKWATWCKERNHIYRGDQEALSAMIDKEQIKVQILPKTYNYSRMDDETKPCKIYHWHGNPGKCVIKAKIELNKTYF